jgi:lysophospholipase L1-like esterase
MNGFRPWAIRLLVATTATIIALALGDLLLSRLRPRPASEVTPEAEQAADSAYQQAPWIGRFGGRTVDMHAVIQAFAWEPQTGAAANSWGFRAPEFTLAQPPDTVRVVIVGDSITWGQGVAMDETFWAVLERELTTELRRRRLKVEVIPLAVCGSRLVDNVIRLEVLGQRLSPDLVVVQYFPNDLEDRPVFRRRDILEEMGRQSSLVRAVRMVRDRDAFWDQLAAHTDPASREWRQFAAAADALGAWSREHSVPVVVPAFPPTDLRPNGGNFDAYRDLAEFEPLLRPPLKALEEAGLHVIDLRAALGREAGHRFLCVSTTDGHPNALAHRITGRALADRFRSAGWISAWTNASPTGDADYPRERELRERAARDWASLNADYSPQREIVDALLAIHPEEPWLVAQSAALDQQMGRFVEACAGWQRLADRSPDSSAPWYHRSLCAPDDDAREAALERMLRVVPDHAPSVEEQLGLARRRGEGHRICDRAVELAGLARYPEQFARAHEAFRDAGCSDLGFDFWNHDGVAPP